jgi:hypothetical protein
MVIHFLFAHPHARFENTMSQETVPSSADALQAAIGASGPCHQEYKFFLTGITAMAAPVNNNKHNNTPRKYQVFFCEERKRSHRAISERGVFRFGRVFSILSPMVNIHLEVKTEIC